MENSNTNIDVKENQSTEVKETSTDNQSNLQVELDRKEKVIENKDKSIKHFKTRAEELAVELEANKTNDQVVKSFEGKFGENAGKAVELANANPGLNLDQIDLLIKSESNTGMVDTSPTNTIKKKTLSKEESKQFENNLGGNENDSSFMKDFKDNPSDEYKYK